MRTHPCRRGPGIGRESWPSTWRGRAGLFLRALRSRAYSGGGKQVLILHDFIEAHSALI